jgi:multidrug resistance efflux pump
MVIQGMVDRAVHLSALSEVKIHKDELQAKLKELAWLEAQVLTAKEQMEQARKETAQLQAVISTMVSRSELDTAKTHFQEVETAARGEIQKQREVILAMNDRLRRLEDEKNSLAAQMQVLLIF